MALTKDEIMDIPLKFFGLPDERKFPMHDDIHLKAAIGYFYTASNDKRKELADNIIKRHRQLKSNIKITRKNPLFKFIPEDMKNLEENVGLYTLQEVEALRRIVDAPTNNIIESLISRTDLDDIDDLDSAIPDEYSNKNRLLGILKSIIMNPDSNYALIYLRFTPTTNDLSRNNGGINRLKDFDITKYNNTLNESAIIDPISDITHVEFCSILREWNELYTTYHRNPVYDNLMVESWRRKVISLLEQQYSQHVDQKLKDLGITNYSGYIPYKFDTTTKAIELELDSLLEDKKDEVSHKLLAYETKHMQKDNLLTPSIDIDTSYETAKRYNERQEEEDRTYDYEKYY